MKEKQEQVKLEAAVSITKKLQVINITKTVFMIEALY